MYTLGELIPKTYNELLLSGLKEKTVYGGNWYIWNRLTRLYGNDATFKEEMVNSYCLDYFKRDIFSIENTNLLPIEKRYIIAFNNLIQSSKNIPFEKFNYYFHKEATLSEKSQKLLDGYIQKSIEDGNGERTIENKKLRIRNFLIDFDIDTKSKDDVVNYLTKRRNEMNLTAYTIEIRLIRRFLLYCYELRQIDKVIIMNWPDRMTNIIDKQIPSHYSSEEIKTLIEFAKNYEYEDNHLRNYAILCLIAYTGIRANDVINLKTENINWRDNIIRFTQQKNKKELILPLIPQVGNPIAKYLLEERKSGDYLFTNENGEKMITQCITKIINNYFCASPIQINGRHYGAHSLRHSIATNMINASVPIFNIANTLGHSNTRSVNIYAKVDLNSLRKCVLEAPYNA